MTTDKKKDDASHWEAGRINMQTKRVKAAEAALEAAKAKLDAEKKKLKEFGK